MQQTLVIIGAPGEFDPPYLHLNPFIFAGLFCATFASAFVSAFLARRQSSAKPWPALSFFAPRFMMGFVTDSVIELAATAADWELLARDGAALEARIGAVRRLVQSDDPRADVLCTRFLDHVATTGDLQEAFDTAIVAARAGTLVPDEPDRREAGAPPVYDRGPRLIAALEVEMFAALAQRSFRLPNLTRWLVAGACEPNTPADELHAALEAIARANLEVTLREGVERIVTLCPWLYIVPRVWVIQPALFAALLETIACVPNAEGRHWGIVELDAPPLDAAVRTRVVELARSAPNAVRAVAIAALVRSEPADEIDSTIVAAFLDPSADTLVVEAAARLAIARASFDAPVMDAAMLAVQRDDTKPLRALIANARARLAGPPTTRACANSSVVEGSFAHVGAPFLSGELGVTAARRARRLVTETDLATDDDEYAVAVVGRGVAAYHVAPIQMPSYRTYEGRRRGLDVIGVHDGHVVLSITIPFRERVAWGNDTFLLGCDPRDGSWVSYRREGERDLVVDRRLGPEPVAESELANVSGPWLVWIDDVGLHCSTDPVHLDPYDRTELMQPFWDARKRCDEAARAAEIDPILLSDAELTAAWSAFDPAQRDKLRVLECTTHRVALIEATDRQALVWLAR